MMRARAGSMLALAAALGAGSCGQAPPPRGMPAYTDHYEMRISTDPMPARARERTTFKLVVRDKATRQPIDGGEGLIYGNPQDTRVKAWDSFVQGKEPGTYYANIHYVVAGDWAMALEFRRDSTQKLEKVEWVQSVHNASAEP
ncbi:MAG TPA: hypothetical protein VMT93_07145 [Gemmatimonadaceae bacterium]|nr:hypothetical protein [Gemmatimonadaceae bacterium]